ncbi:hypothetical protein ACFX5Q_29085 [Mesorhizobium sp. IMUNJ 23033]|uniref:hypothetical protein n=1 Tax=Mesorhizobium sp. IMUNJ 23033 TaxID=3378039 RepID=UPI003850C062
MQRHGLTVGQGGRARKSNRFDEFPLQALLLTAQPFSLLVGILPFAPHRHRMIGRLACFQIAADKRVSI